jgi:hypothetical protein
MQRASGRSEGIGLAAPIHSVFRGKRGEVLPITPAELGLSAAGKRSGIRASLKQKIKSVVSGFAVKAWTFPISG